MVVNLVRQHTAEVSAVCWQQCHFLLWETAEVVLALLIVHRRQIATPDTDCTISIGQHLKGGLTHR